ncbi:hypothetical protein WDW86_05885 [Bdellovibrionota bacterium FG-2]
MKNLFKGWGVFLAVLFALAAQSPQAFAFGYEGSSGWSGRSGHSGDSGPDLTVFADGSSGIYNLSGADGSDGEDGMPGQDAGGCYPEHRPHYNIWGASGGDGGRGGSGGNGGSGGDITIYFEKFEDLKKIGIVSKAGRAGRAGRGTQGGRPCSCFEGLWTVTQCNNQGLNCGQITYSCTNGRMGYDGADGVPGVSGSQGSAILIKSNSALLPTTQSGYFPLGTLGMGREITLSENLWSSQGGALGLFAPGSALSDVYSFFEGRVARKAQVVWNADRPSSDFSGETISAYLGGGKVRFAVPSSLWAETAQVDQGEGSSLSVSKAFKEEEIGQVTLQALEGREANLVLKFEDQQGISSLVKTRVHLEIAVKHLLVFYSTRFKGDVPAQFVSSDGKQIEVELGKLIPNASKWLKEGKKVRIRATLTRSFGGRSIEVPLAQVKKVVP